MNTKFCIAFLEFLSAYFLMFYELLITKTATPVKIILYEHNSLKLKLKTKITFKINKL